MTVTLPNLNEAIAGLDGRLLPFGWLRCCGGSRCAGVTSGRMPLMGIAKRLQGTTKGAAIALGMIERIRRHYRRPGLPARRAVLGARGQSPGAGGDRRHRRRALQALPGLREGPGMTGARRSTALVLAGSRRGEARSCGPLPAGGGTSAWSTAGGVPMLVRVVRRWRPARESAGSWCRSTSRRSLDRAAGACGRCALPAGCESWPAPPASAPRSPRPSRSLARRLLVTTADHALLDPAMVAHFLAAAERHRSRCRGGAGLGGGDHRRLPRDAGAPTCAFATAATRAPTCSCCARRRPSGGIAFWQRIERDRKAPWRLARAFGPVLLARLSAAAGEPGRRRCGWSRGGSA